MVEEVSSLNVFHESLKMARYVMKLYGYACSSIYDGQRATTVNVIADHVVKISDAVKNDMDPKTPLSTGETDITKKNRILLMATLTNCMYIDRLLVMLPWISQIFSVDSIEKLLLEKEGYNTELLQEHKDMWREMFFVMPDNTLFTILEARLKSSKSSITNAILMDTKYVYNIVYKKPGAEAFISLTNPTPEMDLLKNDTWLDDLKTHDSQVKKAKGTLVRMLSRYHLTKFMIDIARNLVESVHDQQVVYKLLEYAYNYVNSVPFMFQNANTLFKSYEEEAKSALYAISRSSILSFVKLRANKEQYMLRHKMYVPSKDANKDVKTLVVKYSTNFQGLKGDFNDYDQTYSFGPFSRVFGNQHSNDDVAEGSYDVVYRLINEKKSVVVMGFGISGAGKTSTLIYKRPKNKDKPEEGIILKWLEKIMTHDNNKMSDGIAYCAVEFYGRDINYDGSNSVQNEYMRNMNKPIPSRCEADNILVKNREFEPLPQIVQKHWQSVQRDAKQGIKAFIEAIKDVINTRIEDSSYRQTKPTPNNDSSSRSHVIITFKISNKINEWNDCSFLHVVDLAGVENRFATNVDPIVKQFVDIDKVKQSCRIKDVQMQNQMAVFNEHRGQTVSNKETQPCTCFERYVFNDLDFPFVYHMDNNKIQNINDEETNKWGNDDAAVLFGKVRGYELRQWMLNDNPAPVIPKLQDGNTTYSYRQLWGSVVMNPFAWYEGDKVTVPLLGKNFTKYDDAARSLKNAVENRMRHYSNTSIFLTKDLTEIVKQFKELDGTSIKELRNVDQASHLMRLWAEPFLVWQTADNPECTVTPNNESTQHLPCKKAAVMLPLARKNGNVSAANYFMHVTDPVFIWINGKGDVVTKSAHGIKALHNSIGQYGNNYNMKNFDNLTNQMYLEQDFVPPYYTMPKPEAILKDISYLTVSKLRSLSDKAMKALGNKTYNSDQAINDMKNVFNLFKSNTSVQSTNTLWIKVCHDHHKIARIMQGAFGANYERLRDFLTLFSSVKDQAQLQSIYAYLHMAYGVVARVLATNGLFDERAQEVSLTKVNELREPKTLGNILKGLACEGMIRAAVPTALYIAKQEAQATAPGLAWNKSALQKIVTIDQTTNGMSFNDHQSSLPCTLDTDPEHYAFVVDVLEGKSDMRILNLPLKAEPPVTMDTFKPSMDRTDVESMINFIVDAKDNLHDWIDLLFLYGMILGGIDNIAKYQDIVMNNHVEHYMNQRSAEGSFINFTVNNMRESMNEIVNAQQKNVNPYGNPSFLSGCSFFGCHPLLDEECYRDSSKDTRKNTSMDPVFTYLRLYTPNANDLQLCMMTVINLTKDGEEGGVVDPPAVPFIRYTTLMHAIRLHNFLIRSDEGKFVSPASLSKPVKSTDTGGDSILDDQDIPEINFKRTNENKGDFVGIENPLGLDIVARKDVYKYIASGLIEALAEIKNANVNMLKGVEEKIYVTLKTLDMEEKKVDDYIKLLGGFQEETAAQPQIPDESKNNEQVGGGDEDDDDDDDDEDCDCDDDDDECLDECECDEDDEDCEYEDDDEDDDGAKSTGSTESTVSTGSTGSTVSTESAGSTVSTGSTGSTESAGSTVSTGSTGSTTHDVEVAQVHAEPATGSTGSSANYVNQLPSTDESDIQRVLASERQQEQEQEKDQHENQQQDQLQDQQQDQQDQLQDQQQDQLQQKQQTTGIKKKPKTEKTVLADAKWTANFNIYEVHQILDSIVRYNTASLIGNLAFVDSLQKRGVGLPCDQNQQHSLFTINLPELCAESIKNENDILSTYKELSEWKIKPDTYIASNIKKLYEKNLQDVYQYLTPDANNEASKQEEKTKLYSSMPPINNKSDSCPPKSQGTSVSPTPAMVTPGTTPPTP